jgi:Tol biopolymer transport system component
MISISCGTIYSDLIEDRISDSENSLIAFESTMDGDQEIYSIVPDATGLKRITSSSGMDKEPAWSPLGQQIIFCTYGGALYPEIYGINRDGSSPHNISNWSADGDEQPAMSPNGIYIAYMRTLTTNREIFRFNTTTGGAGTQLTNTGGPWSAIDDINPSWSPDSASIAFSSVRDGNYQIYTMGWDGSSQTRLTNNTANDYHPSWSPDGNYIAFSRDAVGNQDIYIININTLVERRLTTNTDIDTHPSWSPDGTRIVFTSNRDGDYELYVMSFASGEAGGLVQLTNNTVDDLNPVWSPNLD